MLWIEWYNSLAKPHQHHGEPDLHGENGLTISISKNEIREHEAIWFDRIVGVFERPVGPDAGGADPRRRSRHPTPAKGWPFGQSTQGVVSLYGRRQDSPTVLDGVPVHLLART